MNTYLLFAAGALSILIGIAHSVLGEKLLLRPLFAHGEVTRLLGSRVFARRTIRFTWHLTTLLAVGIGVAIFLMAAVPLTPQAVLILRIFAVTFAASSLLSLVGARGKHFSWWVFLIISVLLWIGSSS
jgi:hypothetical protein